ncbi:YwqJ-related putative deaminase [Streptomyces olivaceiscleroticus]|uniref:YwqJ-related putative deaminase n=1 Tax=Streptomyces olivaceiscleroticus TaxID=68245 RepID=UPI0031F8DFDA
MWRTTLSEQLPAVASSLLIHGKVLSHTSLIGPGSPNLHPAIRDFVAELPAGQRKSFTGRCAESALLSDQLWQLDAGRELGRTTTLSQAAPHFAGAAMTSRKIREPGNPEHGEVTEPCPVCSALLETLGVRVLR